MIDPQSLDLTSLPFVCLADRSLLPPVAGIYLAIDSLGVVQYIGKASGKDGLNGRWKSTLHHRYHQLEGMGGIKIAYLSVDTLELLPAIEKALIDWFDPPLNIRLKSSAKVLNNALAEKMARTSITIPEELLEEFKQYCDEQRRSVSAQIAFMIEEALRGQKSND